MKFKCFILIFILTSCFRVEAQNNTFRINPATQQVIMMDATYLFHQTYSYDFHMKNPTSYAYPALCVVIINMQDDGVGTLITDLDGDSNVFRVTSCYKSSDRYSFSLLNKYGKPFDAVLHLENGYVDMFWIKLTSNLGMVFSN